MVSLGDGVCRDQFHDACWAVGDVGVHPPKVIERIMDAFVEGDSPLLLRSQGVLHGAEDVSGSRESQRH